MSSFLDDFAQQIVNLAAKKDEDFVLIDGVLKKGYWRTINHNHVFIVDGKIEAGPPAFIGQDPKNIDWDSISEKAKDDEKENGPLYTKPREAVTKKYETEVLKLRTKGVTKEKRERELSKIWHKMAAEDEFHVIFLDQKKPSPVLEDLAKAFGDYGNFPVNGSPKSQISFYKDRLSLLEQLYDALPEDKKSDITPHMEHLKDTLDRFIAKVKPEDLEKDEEPKKKDEQKPDSEERDSKDASKPRKVERDYVPQPRGSSHAKSSIMMLLEALLRGLLSMLIVKLFTTGDSKSIGKTNKLLYSITKKTLSHTTTKKRENFFDSFEQMFKRKKSN